MTYLQSWTKDFAKKKEIRPNRTRPENFNISFCISYDHWWQKLISGGKIAH